jgi:hypothetical protein
MKNVLLFCSTLFVIIIQTSSVCATQSAFEKSPILNATTILPSEKKQSPLYKVEDQVLNNGFVNTYHVSSEFGRFEVVSTPSLIILLHEIGVIAAMKKIERDDVFVDSLHQSAKNTAHGIKRLFTEPGETLKGAGEGIKGLFARADESLTKSDPSDAEDSRTAQILGFSKAKGIIANQFTVSVYTGNTVLMEELESLAKANFFGGLGMAVIQTAVPGGAGVILSASSAVRLLNETVNLTPPTELRVQNRQKLTTMGVDEDLIQLFINNPAFTPRNQTFFVTALEKLDGADNRELFIKVALQLHDTDTIMLVTRISLMFAAYHNNITPVKRFYPFSRFASARLQDGRVILMLPTDYITWNEEFAGAIDALAREPDKQQLNKAELWTLGTVSKRAQDELSKRGWIIKTNVSKVLRMDQS